MLTKTRPGTKIERSIDRLHGLVAFSDDSLDVERAPSRVHEAARWLLVHLLMALGIAACLF